ncbi:MAG: hypothetical protein ACLQHK_12850 [Gallionellaceae bacterium]
MPNPLAEVFGFPTDNFSPEAKRARNSKLCPYNNKVPNCTKDKALDPLGEANGVSIAIVFHKQVTSITPEIIAAFM